MCRRRRDAFRSGRGFTIVELMIVVVIVAILALVALPGYMARVSDAKMSEGITAAGTIRTALRLYAAGHGGNYPTLDDATGDQLGVLSIVAEDLEGKYFQATDFRVRSTPAGYTIRATLDASPDYWYEIDQDGNEARGWD